jgi:hypothetical protein
MIIVICLNVLIVTVAILTICLTVTLIFLVACLIIGQAIEVMK